MVRCPTEHGSRRTRARALAAAAVVTGGLVLAWSARAAQGAAAARGAANASGARAEALAGVSRNDPSTSAVRSDAGPAASGAPVAAWLASAGIAADHVGLVALPLDGGAPLLQHNPARALNPASTMKLVTTFAALSLLGPEYRWRTSAFLRGRLESGVLRGDLVLRGGGDPKLVVEDLAEFVARMRESGLREIAGDLVVDDAIYDVGPASVDPFDGDPSQPYNVRPFGLMMNFKATRVVVQPAGLSASIELDPALAGVSIDNEVRVLRGPCRHGISGLEVRDGGPDAQPRVRVSGSYSAACGEQSAFTAVLTHRQFVEALFRAAWTSAGGIWSGRARVERGAGTGTPWLEWVSPRTLADVVRDVNKFSNNVMARHLLLQLASDSAGPDGASATPERSRGVLHAWLARQGLDFPELVVDNGSGLSRSERISPAHLARLLVHAASGRPGRRPRVDQDRQPQRREGDRRLRRRGVGAALRGGDDRERAAGRGVARPPGRVPALGPAPGMTRP